MQCERVDNITHPGKDFKWYEASFIDDVSREAFVGIICTASDSRFYFISSSLSLAFWQINTLGFYAVFDTVYRCGFVKNITVWLYYAWNFDGNRFLANLVEGRPSSLIFRTSSASLFGQERYKGPHRTTLFELTHLTNCHCPFCQLPVFSLENGTYRHIRSPKDACAVNYDWRYVPISGLRSYLGMLACLLSSF